MQADPAPRVVATAAAIAEIRCLRAEHGPLMFFQSGGCCDGSSPMCFPDGELLLGQNDLLLGEIDGCAFHIAATLGDWLTAQGVKTAFVEKGSPQQNAFVERYNGSMRDELLNGEEFDSLLEARVVIGEWVEQYNSLRPHRGLGMLTPAAFAKAWKEGPK